MPIDLTDYELIPKWEFDGIARAKQFIDGPYRETFGEGEYEPYVSPQNKFVFGTVISGRKVKARQLEV